MTTKDYRQRPEFCSFHEMRKEQENRHRSHPASVAVESDEGLSDRVTVFTAVSGGVSSAESIMETPGDRLRVRPRVVIADAAELRSNLSMGNSRKVNRFLDLREKSLI